MNPPPQSPHAQAAELVQLALREYESALVGYAAGIVRDVDLARDAVQDTLVKLYQQIPGKVSEASLKAWLYTVCRNRCVDMLRRRKRLFTVEESELDALQENTPYSAEVCEYDASVRERLANFLQRLPQNQQEVLRLKFQGDLSYKEISEATGLTTSNVGFLLHAALKRLRGWLGAEAGELLSK